MVSASTPDRDAFLRKLEKQQRQVMPSIRLGDETLRFLKETGVEASQVDPSSLEALNELVSPSEKKASKLENFGAPDVTAVVSSKGEIRQKKDKVCMEPDINNTLQASAPKTSSFGEYSNYNESESNVARVGQSVELSDSQMILKHLEMQNAMISDMQRRIDHLTDLVHNLSVRGEKGSYEGVRKNSIPVETHLPAPQNHQQVDFPPNNHLHIQQREHIEANPPRELSWFSDIPSRFRESRTFKLWCLFWSLHQRHVRLNFGLIIKVFLVVTIFSAKMMTRKKAQEGDFWSAGAKFYLVLGLVMTGFLIQSGYLNFFYRFFVKENYVDRIYRGEDINADEVNWQDPPQRNENHNRNLRNLIPRDNLFAGNVPRPNGFNILADILVLFGSFLLSLLPMWKPQRPEEEPREMNPVNPPEDIDIHAADEDGDNDNDGNGGQN